MNHLLQISAFNAVSAAALAIFLLLPARRFRSPFPVRAICLVVLARLVMRRCGISALQNGGPNSCLGRTKRF